MVKVIQGYILNQVIGQGNFGLVYRATHKEKSGLFAVKVIPIQKFQENQRLETYQNNQIEALQAIGVSDYIIRFYQIIKSKNNCYLVYEYCNGGTLLNVLRKQQRLEQKKALVIFRQLLEAFKILNKNSIMHRDLKPQNIFFTSQNQQQGAQNSQNDKKKVKLGDFGFCKGLKPDQNLAKTMLGSPIYMAPQVLKGEAYTTKADIWSLGVILFQMLYGYCPYESKSIASLISTIDTQTVQLPNKYPVSERTQNLIKRMLTKDYFRRIGWVQLFNIKIDENGEYVDEPNISLSLVASEDRGSTPNKKVFSSLFGSLPLGSAQLPVNNRSYSSIREQQAERRNQIKTQQSRFSHRKQGQESTALAQTNRVNSQPKDQKRFYSQNYINILSTPLSLKKLQNDASNEDKNKEKSKMTQNIVNNDRDKPTQKSNTPMSPIISPPIFRQERLTSMDNLELVTQQSIQSGVLVGSNNIQSIPFNKYRQTIGMGSRLSNQFLSDRNIKQPTRHSSSQYTPSNTIQNQGAQVTDLNVKRNNLLKIHEAITKIISKAMAMLQQKFLIFKNTKKLSDFCIIKDLLQDCYIVLKIVQQKLKSITQSIKITQTSLLDMATIVNYEHIQVEKFIIQVRNQLIRCSVQLPNMPSNLHLSKVDRIQNANNFKEMIKNRQVMQIIDDCA